jgi:hypothetical protein
MHPLSFRWWFEDRTTGRITIAHLPNRRVLAATAASVIAWLTRHRAGIGSRAARSADALWAAWAVDELLRGVNPWRRTLGATALGWVAVRGVGRARRPR